MKILLIQDAKSDASLVTEMLRQVPIDPLELMHEVKVSKALTRLRAERYDVILLDLPLPVNKTLVEVEQLCSAATRSPVVVLGGIADEELALHVMRCGAQDFVPKDNLNPAQLARVLRYAIERKRVMDEQMEQMSRYRTLTHAASDGIISTNDKGDIIFWNASAERIFGYTEKQVMGKSLRMLMPERYYVSFVAELRRFRDLKTIPPSTRNLQLHSVRKGGSEFPIELSIGTWRHGDAMWFTAIVRDISDRKLAESVLLQSRDELSALTRRLHAIQEEERSRIALKVHDELGQSLTALKLDLAWLERRLEAVKQKEVRKKITEMTEQIDLTIDDVRQIASDLRPGLLDHFGLPAAIEWLFREYTERTSIQCTLTVNPAQIAISRDSAILLFRVAQEALTNVARHAKATKLKVALSQEDGHLQIDIQDNGKGITPASSGSTKSLGLLGIRERVKSVGGQMKISGKSGMGTLLSVEIPHLHGGREMIVSGGLHP